MFAEHRAVDVFCLLRKDFVLATKPQQIAVQLVNRAIFFALGKIEFAPLERLRRSRIGKMCLRRREREARKFTEELRAALSHAIRKNRRRIGEKHKWRRSRELLPLKQHRRLRREQQERRHRTKQRWRSALMHAQSESGVRDLIVIFQKIDERFRRKIRRPDSAPLLDPLRVLALKQIAALYRRNEFLRCPAI